MENQGKMHTHSKTRSIEVNYGKTARDEIELEEQRICRLKSGILLQEVIMGNHRRNTGRKLTSYIFNVIAKNGNKMRPDR